MDLASDAAMSFVDGDQVTGEGLRPFRANVEFPEQLEMFGGQSKPGQVLERPVMSYATAAPGRTLLRTDRITIKGVTYGLQNIRRVHDGAVSTADLVKPPA